MNTLAEDKKAIGFLKDRAKDMIECLEHDIAHSTYDGIKGHSPEDERELAHWKSALSWLEMQKEPEVINDLTTADAVPTWRLQFRAEAAKDILCVLLAHPERVYSSDGLFGSAVSYTDGLIKQLGL